MKRTVNIVRYYVAIFEGRLLHITNCPLNKLDKTIFDVECCIQVGSSACESCKRFIRNDINDQIVYCRKKEE